MKTLVCMLGAVIVFATTVSAVADAFILEDGTCIEGKVWASTSSNIFVRLSNGKNRNIFKELLDRRIEGDDARCPERAERSVPGVETEEGSDRTETDLRGRAKELTLDLGDGVTMDLLLIPAGEYWMGNGLSPTEHVARFGGTEEGPQREHPRHLVNFLEPFYMGKCEVTNAQFHRFKPHHDSGQNDGLSLNAADQPVVKVSWHDARAFGEWLGGRNDYEVRLPSDAEWEYACRTRADLRAARSGTGGFRVALTLALTSEAVAANACAANDRKKKSRRARRNPRVEAFLEDLRREFITARKTVAETRKELQTRHRSERLQAMRRDERAIATARLRLQSVRDAIDGLQETGAVSVRVMTTGIGADPVHVVVSRENAKRMLADAEKTLRVAEGKEIPPELELCHRRELQDVAAAGKASATTRSLFTKAARALRRIDDQPDVLDPEMAKWKRAIDDSVARVDEALARAKGASDSVP